MWFAYYCVYRIKAMQCYFVELVLGLFPVDFFLWYILVSFGGYSNYWYNCPKKKIIFSNYCYNYRKKEDIFLFFPKIYLDVLRLNHLKISLDFSKTIWYNIITQKGTEFPNRERNFRKNENLLRYGWNTCKPLWY